MRDTIKSLYNIEPQALVKYSNKVYKVKCDDSSYCLKYVDHLDDGKIKERIHMLKMNSFIMPLNCSSRADLSLYRDKPFYLSNWIDDDYVESKDLKLKYYLKEIGLLHQKSSFSSNVPQSYFHEIKMQIEEKQQESYFLLDKWMNQIEHSDYKSPYEWFYTNNFNKLIESLDKSKEYLTKFNECCKNKNVVRQTIIHQNFSYDHIFINQDKIIGNDKMEINSPVYEFTSLFNVIHFGQVDLSGCLNEYLQNNRLEDYEKYWILSLLFIPHLQTKEKEDFKNLVSTMQCLFHYKSVCEIEELFASHNK